MNKIVKIEFDSEEIMYIAKLLVKEKEIDDIKKIYFNSEKDKDYLLMRGNLFRKIYCAKKELEIID